MQNNNSYTSEYFILETVQGKKSTFQEIHGMKDSATYRQRSIFFIQSASWKKQALNPKMEFIDNHNPTSELLWRMKQT